MNITDLIALLNSTAVFDWPVEAEDDEGVRYQIVGAYEYSAGTRYVLEIKPIESGE